jgi:phospholipase/carboxylesterase
MKLERRTVRVGERSAAPLVVLLHGYDGMADDLIPFARSIGISATFVFPEGPLRLSSERAGRAWWTPDGSRARALATGTPRDLSGFEPPGLPEVRGQLAELLDELDQELGSPPLVLGGYSQGAMLAFDLALRSDRAIAGMVQLSGGRIAARRWNPLLPSRRGMRAFISHGRGDPDLSFAAAETFSDDLRTAGWQVDFCAFDGVHEISLVALRGLKKFLAQF